MRKIFIIFMLGLMAISCGITSPQTFPQNQNFPLTKFAEIPSNDKVQKIAVSDTWLAIQDQNNLVGFDLTTKKQLWSMPFHIDTDSRFSIVNDNLVADSGTQIVVINKSGQEKIAVTVNIMQLISVDANFLYVVQGANWRLSVYDLSKNTLLWKIPVGRGITNVHLDSSTGIVYVVTTDSVRAFDNLSGTLLWQQERGAWYSTLNNGVLYLCEPIGQSNSYKLSAINIENQQEIWSKTFSGDVVYTYGLVVIDQMLIVSTRKGLIAVDNHKSGRQPKMTYSLPLPLNSMEQYMLKVLAVKSTQFPLMTARYLDMSS